MFDWLSKYQEASAQTKYFILNWVFYSILIIISTVYCYARIDYVRSGRAKAAAIEKTTKNEIQTKSF